MTRVQTISVKPGNGDISVYTHTQKRNKKRENDEHASSGSYDSGGFVFHLGYGDGNGGSSKLHRQLHHRLRQAYP